MECSIKSSVVGDQEVLNNCVNLEDIGSITIDKIIGKGTYGVVYSGRINYFSGSSKKIAIKKIEFKRNKLRSIEREIKYNKELGDKKIGPEYITSFYRNIDNENGIAYIIMERMDGDCHTYLASKFNDLQHKIYVINYMIYLIGKSLDKTDIICMDMKAANFLYRNVENEYEVDVRMSDFGEFCFKNISHDFYEKIFKILKKNNLSTDKYDILETAYLMIYVINVYTLLVDLPLFFSNKELEIVINNLELNQLNDFKKEFYEIFEQDNFYDTDELIPFKHYSSKLYNTKALMNFLKFSNNAIYELLRETPSKPSYKRKSKKINKSI